MSEVDVRDLTDGERGELSSLLAEYGVRHEFAGGDLLAPAAEGRYGVPPRSPMEAAVAPRWRRFVGWLLESYAFMALVWVAESAVEGAGGVTAVALAVLNDVVLVRWRGQTVGMVWMRVRITAPPESYQPALAAVLVRWWVSAWPAIVLVAAGGFLSPSAEAVVVMLNTVWIVVCFAPILWDRFARGLHDRAAGTVVLMADYAGPLIDPRSA